MPAANDLLKIVPGGTHGGDRRPASQGLTDVFNQIFSEVLKTNTT
jgi:hypothetical protein